MEEVVHVPEHARPALNALVMVLRTTQTNHLQNRNQHGSKPKTNENGEEMVKWNRT
jgi:hypothetical protein